MALNPNTKALIAERKNEIMHPEGVPITPAFSGWESLTPNKVSGAQPIQVDKSFEDYSSYIPGKIDPIYGDIDEARAQAQNSTLGGRALTMMKTVPRIVTKAVAEVAKMPGTLYGFGNWAADGFDLNKFSDDIDNAWTKSIDKAYEATNDALMPVYKRRAVEEGGFFRQIVSPEFWATEGADGAGFMLGFMAPGAALKLLDAGKYATKGLQLAGEAANLSKASEGAGMLSKAAKFAKLELSGEKALKLAGNIDDFSAAGINTGLESLAEGVESAKGVTRSQYDKKFKELTASGLSQEDADKYATEYSNSDEVKTMAGKAGRLTTLTNLAILMGPNILDQKYLMSGKNKIISAAEKVESGKMAKAIANTLDPTELGKIGRYTGRELGKQALKYGTVGVLKEGVWEEGMQSATSSYFQHKADMKEDPSFIEGAGGIVKEYFDSLSDIDMQKSIFLGAVMGGIGGGIAAVKSKNREDKIIFGDPKTGKKGFIKLLEDNLVDRYKSVNDMALRDSDGKIVENDGVPVIDIMKAQAWGQAVMDSQANKELAKTYDDLEDEDGIRFAKTVSDFNYMLPFFEQEGGKSLLINHINQLAEKDAKYQKDVLGIDPKSVQDTKADLLNKVDRFEKLYHGTLTAHKNPNIKVDVKDTQAFKTFNVALIDKKVSNILQQDFNEKRLSETNNEIAKLEVKETLIGDEKNNLNVLKHHRLVYETELKKLQDAYEKNSDPKKIASDWREVIKDKKNTEAELVNEVLEQFHKDTNDVNTQEQLDKLYSNIDKSTLDDTEKVKLKDSAKKNLAKYLQDKKRKEENEAAAKAKQAAVVNKPVVVKSAVIEPIVAESEEVVGSQEERPLSEFDPNNYPEDFDIEDTSIPTDEIDTDGTITKTKPIVEKVVPEVVAETKPVANTLPENNDIEAKKADIEKERQTELDSYSHVIRVKIEKYRTLDTNDNPAEVEITTNKDGSRLLRARIINEDGSVDNMAYATENINNKAQLVLTNEKLVEAYIGNEGETLNKISEDLNPTSAYVNKINSIFNDKLAALETNNSFSTTELNKLDETQEVEPITKSQEKILKEEGKKEEFDRELDKVSTQLSIAYSSKESDFIDGKHVDKIGENGKVILDANVNQKLFDPEYANVGTELFFQVDKEWQHPFEEDNYELRKNDIDNVPIKITNKEGEFIGYVHDISNIQDKENLDIEVKNRLIEETRQIRNFFKDNHNLIASSKVAEKTPGWLNLNYKKPLTLEEAFSNEEGKFDDRVLFRSVTGGQAIFEDANIDIANKSMLDKLKGVSVVAVPSSNGQYLIKILKQTMVKDLSKEVKDELINNVTGLIIEATRDHAVTSNQLLKEIRKYVFAQNKSAKEVKSHADSGGMKLDLLFNVDLFVDSRTGERDVTIYVKEGNGYSRYKIQTKDEIVSITKLGRGKAGVAIDTKVTINEFKGILESAVGDKYLNLSKNDLINPSLFERRVVVGSGYEMGTVKEDYRHFLSKTNAVSTYVHGVVTEQGTVTYTTQPNIVYEGGLQEVKPAKKARKARVTKKSTMSSKEIDKKDMDISTDLINIMSKNLDRDLEKAKTLTKEFSNLITPKERTPKQAFKEIIEFLSDSFGWKIEFKRYESGKFDVSIDGIDTTLSISGSIFGGAQTFLDANLNEIIAAKYKAQLDSIESKSTTDVKETLILPDDVEEDNMEIISEFEPLKSVAINFGKSKIASFSLIKNVVKENEVVGSLVSNYLSKYDSFDLSQNLEVTSPEQKDNAIYEQIINELKQYNEAANLGTLFKGVAANKQVAKYTQLVIDNFNESVDEYGNVIFIGYKAKIQLELEKIKFHSMEDVFDTENEGEDEKDNAQFIANKNFKTDPEKSASSRIKRALAFLKDQKGNNPKINLIGQYIYRDYAQVFATVMESTANVPINEIYDELESLAKGLDKKEKNNIYRQVVQLIGEGRDSGLFNEFMKVFTKQRTMFIKPIIFPDKDGNPSIILYNSNKSGASGVMSTGWRESFKDTKLSVDDNKMTEAVKKTISSLISRFSRATSIQPTKNEEGELTFAEYYNEISSIFKEVGISVSQEALEKIANNYLLHPERLNSLTGMYPKNNVRTMTTFKTMFQENFRHIFEGLLVSKESKSSEDNDGLSNDIFYTQAPLINVLARFEATVNPSALSNSFRNAAGDVIYGFVNPHHLSNTVSEVKSSSEKREELKKDPFSSKSTWLQEINGRSPVTDIQLSYLDAAVNGKSTKDAMDYEKMSTVEKEQIKAALVFNKNSATGHFLTATPSDKTTFAIISALKEKIKRTDLDEVGLLKSDSELINRLYSLMVESEISRINSTVKLVKDAIKNDTLHELVEGEHYIIKNGKIVLGSRGYFFLMPQMNEVFKEQLNSALEVGEFVPADVLNESKIAFTSQLNNLISIKEAQWKELGMFSRIDKDYYKESKKESGVQYLTEQEVLDKTKKSLIQERFAVTDYLLNTMAAYANQHMIITGDPAIFSKANKEWDGTHNTWQGMIDGTITNMFKRTAKDIAPGYEGLFAKDEQQYNTIFIDEPVRDSRLIKETASSEYTGKLKEQIASSLGKIDFADAQEWTSLPEHVRSLHAFGLITKEQKDRIISKYNTYTKNPSEDNEFTDAEIGLILQPQKPVQVGRVNRGTNNPESTLTFAVDYYIKTSSFPLIPQLTKGLKIDALRRFMDSNKIDRLVPKTAVKTGFFKSIKITDKDGNLLIGENGELAPENFIAPVGNIQSENIHTLDRKFFRIQQDVPYKEDKVKTLEGSQMKKLKYSDIDSSWLFDIEDGNEAGYSGHALKDIDDKIHTEIYKRQFNSLMDKIGATNKNGKPSITDFSKLKQLLVDEAIERNFDYNDIMMLSAVDGELMVDEVPLFMHPALPKIEALMNSLIKNKVLVTKFPGKSYVQGSSMGFDAMVESTPENMQRLVQKGGINFLKGFTGSLGYKIEKKMSHDGKGGKIETEYIIAEVLAPWIFKEKLESFIDADGFIDESKIDPKLLELIGYRIPTQDHGSMAKLKIVGFLPKSSGDLLVIPPELSKIMGSDFDVDKLFTHRYNYEVDKRTGRLSKIKTNTTDISKLSDEQLQNLSLEITHGILEEEHIAERMLIALDNTVIAEVLAEMAEIKGGVKSDAIDFSKASQTSPLMDNIHSAYVDINAAGQVGIGVGSVASTSHVLAQYAGTYLKRYKVGYDIIDNAVRFSNNDNELAIQEKDVNQASTHDNKRSYNKAVTDGLYRLDRIFNISGGRISQVIKNIQTESVDNAKNQRLFGMNLNGKTFDVAMLLAKAGLDEKFIGFFLNQPIILDYVNRLNNVSDIGSTEFDGGKSFQIQKEIWNKYAEMGGKLDFPDLIQSHTISMESMRNNLAEVKDATFQMQVLESFLAYESMGKKLSGLFRAINTDTKYLGKSITSSVVKQEDFERDFLKAKAFGNTKQLMGTLQMAAHEMGINDSLSLFNDLLPYSSSELFLGLRVDLLSISGKERMNEKSMDEIFKMIKSSLWIESWARVSGIDVDAYRKGKLFGKDSTANRLLELQKTSRNTLVNFINVSTSKKDGIPNTIEFPSAGQLEKDFSLKMQQSWLELYNNPETKDFAMDLVGYCMVNGNNRNARDFSRFIPIDILQDSGILKTMREVYNEIVLTDKPEQIDVMRKQFIQHNPSKAFAQSQFDYTDNDNPSKEISSISSVKSLSLKGATISAESVPNEFIYFYDSKAYKQVLFQRDSADKTIAHQIPLLGNKKSLLMEYNLAEPNKSSIFVKDKSEQKEEFERPFSTNESMVVEEYAESNEPESRPFAPDVAYEEKSKKPVGKTFNSDIAKFYGFSEGIKSTYILAKLANSNKLKNEGLVALANFLQRNHSELLNSTILVDGTDWNNFGEEIKADKATSSIPGAFLNFHGKTKDRIVIDFALIRDLGEMNEYGFEAMSKDDMLALVLMHEMLHKIVASKNATPAMLAVFDKFKKEALKDPNNRVTSKYTASYSEFISGVFTDKEFQKYLSTIESGTKGNLLAQLWESIKELLAGDIEVKEGTLLYDGMAEAFNMISKEVKKETNVTEEQAKWMLPKDQLEDLGSESDIAPLSSSTEFGDDYNIDLLKAINTLSESEVAKFNDYKKLISESELTKKQQKYISESGIDLDQLDPTLQNMGRLLKILC